MDIRERLRELSAEHHGVIRTSEAEAAGISKAALAGFIRENGFVRASQGIYCDPEVEPDPFYLLQMRCPRTIFSHDTALFLHHLTDGPPRFLTLTARTGYNPSRLTREGIKVYTVKDSLFPLGAAECLTPGGNVVRVYDRERTVCDMVRSRSSVEGGIFLEVMMRYAGSEQKDLELLMSYASELHVERILQQYLKVLP